MQVLSSRGIEGASQWFPTAIKFRIFVGDFCVASLANRVLRAFLWVPAQRRLVVYLFRGGPAQETLTMAYMCDSPLVPQKLQKTMVAKTCCALKMVRNI